MANCLVSEKGWRLSSECMDCFGRLVDCTAEICPVACYQGGAGSEVCRNCVTNACNKAGATFFDFPNCSGTSFVNTQDLSDCTAPQTTIILGLEDEAFFAIVSAAGLVVLAGLAFTLSRMHVGTRMTHDSFAQPPIAIVADDDDKTFLRPGSLISGAKPEDNSTELSSQLAPKGKARTRGIQGVL